jgi:hypothetical protein
MVKLQKDQTYSIEHCIQRYKERYNKDLTVDEYNKLNKQVQNWFQTPNINFKLIAKDPITKNNYSYILEHSLNGELLYLVFETERNCITTFLPPKSVLERVNKNKSKKK